MATNAVYKVYNGSSWVEYYFKTSAAQVGVSASRKFVTSSTKVNNKSFTLDSSGDGASVSIAGSDITGGASVSSGSLTYITASDTVAAALGKLDQAAKAAYDNIPSGILTTSNYAATLDSVYQAKGNYQAADADLTAIAGLSGTSGLLKKTAANTWALDTNTYVPTSRTVNSKVLSNDIVLYGSDIALSSGSSTKINTAISSLQASVNGMTRSYGLDGDATGTNIYNTQIVEAIDDAGEYTLTLSSSQRTGAKLRLVGGNDILISDLHVGDSLFIDTLDVPDVWVSSMSGWDTAGTSASITFSMLESYDMTWNVIQDKPTTLAGYGITDAKIQNGTITLGSNTITPLTQHQDISGKAPNNHAVNANTYGLGTSSLYGHVKLVSGDLNGKTATDGMAASQAHTHSQYLTSHQSLSGYATETWVDSNFVRCTAGTTTPSSPSTGDIWIDTNN